MGLTQMKGSITLKILEAIGDTAVSIGDLFEAVLEAGYGASVSRMEYKMSITKRHRADQVAAKQEKDCLRQKYYMMVSSMKHDELIEEKRERSRKAVVLTAKGIKKLISLRERYKKQLPNPKYSKTDNNKLIIVAFDIPEREKWKRVWLRAVLKNLNFSMIQKSVWIGKTKIPKDFLDDLAKLKLLDFVEIFEISKTGSLRHIV